MAVGRDSTERISTAIEEPLCFVGDWEGNYQSPFGGKRPENYRVTYINGRWSAHVDAGAANEPCEFVDEGNGKCRMVGKFFVLHGIYKREKGQLFLCFGRWNRGNQRPTDFRSSDRQDLYVLHPAKPPKK